MAESADKAVKAKCSGVVGEQGGAKSAGSAPPANFGHGSAKSGGTSGKIPAK